jgi:hypothetical protein
MRNLVGCARGIVKQLDEIFCPGGQPWQIDGFSFSLALPVQSVLRLPGYVSVKAHRK